MVEANKAKLPRNLIMSILTYLDAKQLFQGKALTLSKKIYYEDWLLKEIAMRHLGIIEDYTSEKSMITNILKIIPS